ncbi:hypothetical protein Pfo_031656 [Paulownia fortunei]|nr:hypothetical protein Pfo_031656 [Paulownia fortunei]
MQNSLQKGSEVVTIGGLHAVVDSVDNAAKTVDLDAEGVILTFELSAIRTIKNPVAPVADKPTVDDLKPAETVEETEKITDDTDKHQIAKGVYKILWWGDNVAQVATAAMAPFSAYAKRRHEQLHVMSEPLNITCQQLSDLIIPTLLVIGEFDLVKRRHIEHIAEIMPHAQVMILKGHGHFVTYTNPRNHYFSDEIGWLAILIIVGITALAVSLSSRLKAWDGLTWPVAGKLITIALISMAPGTWGAFEVAFRLVNNKAIVMGDPLGNHVILLKPCKIFERVAMLAHEFVMTFKLGEEAHVNLADFSTADVIAQMQAISDEWLAGRDKKVAILEKDDRIEAFASLVVSHTEKQMAVDLMRFTASAPNGVMDVLFVNVFKYAKSQKL